MVRVFEQRFCTHIGCHQKQRRGRKNYIGAFERTSNCLREHRWSSHFFFPLVWPIEKSEECLVVMKSRMDLFAQVAERVKGLHSYEVPEILAVPIVDGSKTYFDWLSGVLP